MTVKSCQNYSQVHKTSDLEYSALLAHLNAIPALLPVKRSMTRAKEQEVLFEDLFNKDGEATW